MKPPFSNQHLLEQGLSETFVDYMRGWDGFVAGLLTDVPTTTWATRTGACGRRARAMRQSAYSPGDSSSLRELRAEGRKTGRERISELLDPNSFVEVDAFVQHRRGICCASPGHWVTDGTPWDDRWQEGRLLRSDYSVSRDPWGRCMPKGRKDCRVRREVTTATHRNLGWRRPEGRGGGDVTGGHWRAVGYLGSLLGQNTAVLPRTRNRIGSQCPSGTLRLRHPRLRSWEDVHEEPVYDSEIIGELWMRLPGRGATC